MGHAPVGHTPPLHSLLMPSGKRADPAFGSFTSVTQPAESQRSEKPEGGGAQDERDVGAPRASRVEVGVDAELLRTGFMDE